MEGTHKRAAFRNDDISALEARQFEGKVKGGNILIAVHASDSERRAKAKDVLRFCGAKDIVVVGEASVPASAAPAT